MTTRTLTLPGSAAAAARALVQAHEDDPRWLDRFAEALDRRRSGHELQHVLTVWNLNRSEAGASFGVSRQALTKWLDGGVPEDRAAAIAELSAATDLLVRHLRRERIAAVVRRPASALDDRSLLDLLGTGDTAAVLRACREMFAFGDLHA